MARKSKKRTRKSKSNSIQNQSKRNGGPRPHIRLKNGSFLEAVQVHQQGDMELARQMYEQILAQDADHTEALHLLGLIDHQQGNHEGAIEKIERALVLNPDAILFRKNLASAYRSAGKLEKAKRICDDVLTLEPSEPIVLSLLAKIHEDQAEWAIAIRFLKQAILTESPAINAIELTNDMGDCYSSLGNHTQAINCFESVIEAEPKQIIANHNLAREYQLQQRIPEAEKQYLHTLQIDPTCASAMNNLGVLYQSLAKFELAKQFTEKACELQPQLADVHNNLANIYECLGDDSCSRQMFEKAIALRPDYPEPHHSLSQTELREGNFATGWEMYQWRRKKKEHDHRYYGHKVWEGQALQSERLLVYTEQGVGDVIMFATCLPDLLQRVKQVTVEVDRRLVELIQRSFPTVQVIARPDSETKETVMLERVDLQTSLADLPGFFRNKESEFPRTRQILVPDLAACKKWKTRYEAMGKGLKVGLSWFGGKNIELQSRRSIKTEQLENILKSQGVQFINLQYGDCSVAIQEVQEKFGVKIHDWEDSDPIANLDDFTAKLSQLDLVISIDNATVHFAGAAGVPTWCLLNKLPDWRWLLNREQSVWYPSIKLFRQQKQGDWQPVLNRVQTDLQSLVVDDKFSDQEFDPATPAVSPKEKTCIKPRCAIVTPIGPGHESIYEQASASIAAACKKSAGPFRQIIPYRIDDLQGKIGRSKARNAAVKQAAEQGIEWIFFLDADDVLVPDAFCNVEKYLDEYDAIWGQIYCFDDGCDKAENRDGQLGMTTRFEDILNNDPYHTLQMGHFVRTEIALQHPFDEQMDAGEDFDYYLRVWEKHRCIKLNVPLFVNRRGNHSTGPRSATGRDWMVVVNQMIQQRRQQKSLPVAHHQSPKHVQRGMKLAIYGMMRSGTTLLCDKLTVPGKGIVLLEPNIHLGSRPDHLRKQLEGFGLSISEQDWTTANTNQTFAQFFDASVLPQLNQLDYWGVKMVNFANWEQFLTDYPCEELVLCVRDIRDVVLSALDLAPKLDNFVDEDWIEKRALETAAALVQMAKLPHHLVRYEQMCESPGMIDQLASQMGINQLGEQRLGLQAVPHRLYEDQKHQGQVTNRSVNRYQREPEGPAKQLADRVWKQAGEYCKQFGYPTATTQPELPIGFASLLKEFRTNAIAATEIQPKQKPASETGQDFTNYWETDRLANIIPQNEQLGEFPEGWDVRPYLWESLKPHVIRKMVEIGCGYGRLCQAVPTDFYLGIDINAEAIQKAKTAHPSYDFQQIGYHDAYPKADAILAYTVLLHIDDINIVPMIQRMCEASDVILIAEILGKQRWRRDGNPPVFNRDLQDYCRLMKENRFHLESCEAKPYLHYAETEISFLKFVRK